MNNPHLYNQSLAKGLAILEFIASHNGEATLTIIANHLSMDKATVKRFLNTLVQLGYITSSQHGKLFSITLKALQIGYSAISSIEWREIAKLYLERLFMDVGETVSLCVLDDGEIVYLFRLNREGFVPNESGLAARRSMHREGFLPVDAGIGSRRPAYASAMGKMLLALEPQERAWELAQGMNMRMITPHTVASPQALMEQLALARARGYAISDQEASDLTRSISAPIMHAGKAVAALAVAVRVDDYTVEEMTERMAPKALACAAQIATALQQIEYR